MMFTLCAVLALFSGTSQTSAAPEEGAGRQAGRLERARALWGTSELRRCRLSLPDDRPERLDVPVRLGGRDITLALERHSTRAPGALLRVHLPDGSWREESLELPNTYRGEVVGAQDWVVLASLGEAGLSAELVSADGSRWSIRPLRELETRAARERHVLFPSPHEHWDRPDCGVAEGPWDAEGGIEPFAVQEYAPLCLKQAEIAFDADFEYYQAKGSSVQNVVDAIDAIMNTVDYFYARDVRITHVTTAYVVRTAPFYMPTSGGSLLDQFRNEWTSTQAGVQRDIAHLMTGKPGSLIEYGGLAYVGVTCNPNWMYGWSMDSPNIVGHELGHNWGSGHCHDTTPCNSMCGGCFYFAPNTKDIIIAYRDSVTCLDLVGPYESAVPPYTHPESASFLKNEYETLGTLRFDVLGNDHDGNCDLLFIASVESTTERGGSLSISRGTGPEHRDELVYVPPSAPFVGDDSLRYRIGDGRFLVDGEVVITIEPQNLVGYWSLDEGAGNVVADAMNGGRDGTASGGASWTTGQFGGALEFDGTDDSVVIPPLNLNDDSVTITTWFRRDGEQTPSAGLVFTHDGGSIAGLHFGNLFGELRYTWNGASGSWSSGLFTSNATWVFGALVVEPDRATIHIRDSGVFNDSVRNIPHAPEEFDGELRLGQDDNGGSRYFQGAIDEVRIYDYALSDEEVQDLGQYGGCAQAIWPTDGKKLSDPAGALRWAGSPSADSHDVYLGTDYAAVRAATNVSPEFQGNQTQTSFTPGGLAHGTTYYWRVDERVGGEILEGPVWELALADFGHWRLDETSGLVAEDSEGDDDGSYFGNPLLGQPGASGVLGTSVLFDGFNDRVRIPALNLNSNEVTITAWVRRLGPQDPWAGIVFSRDGNTTAGLNLGLADELRYHWNGVQNTWDWDSGLVVPDDQWVFTALVVEPTRATLHLGQGGTLSSAVNFVTHAPEEFDGVTRIAHDSSSSARYFDGFVDDVRIYDSALTPAEVDALYQSTR